LFSFLYLFSNAEVFIDLTSHRVSSDDGR